MNHQDDGQESSEGRSSVAAARSTLEGRPEALRVAEQRQKTDGCRAEPARGQRRGTHVGFGTEGERTGVAAAEAAEETINVEVQQLEKQDAVANEIESHKNADSSALQEIEETEVSWTGQRLQLSKTRVRARQSVAFRGS